ncbi:MAG: agmatine deiminase family protein [Sumerlaeia bacterium]
MSLSSPQTPAALGYRMPAEWEPHRGTWLSWPHKADSWPGKFETIPPVYAEIVRALAHHEEVHINVVSDAMQRQAEAILRDSGALLPTVFFHLNPTDDAWARDHGPIFVVKDEAPGRRSLAVTDWNFNSWGGKYPPFDQDNKVPGRIARAFDYPHFAPGIVLEGGSIDVNGAGTVLTTEQCLLNENRNPHLSREQIERYLKDYLGLRHVIWLGDGIVGDDTDGHIDDLSRFVGPRTVVTVVEDNPADENYDLLQHNLGRLKTATDQDGHPLNVIQLPMPAPVYCEGHRLPASYANFYIANGVVLMPSYRCDQDAVAQSILQSCFPDRTVVGIDCTDLVWGLGAIHCISQQHPAEVLH